MIKIIVKGNELVLYRNTSIVLELNNALFSDGTIEGDIAYSFAIPIKGNDRSLDYPGVDASDYSADFDCVILIDGLISISGRLFIQQTSFFELAAAVVVNPYPSGFADRSIRDNMCVEQVLNASHQLVTHESCVMQYLKDSVLHEKNIKFAPFINETGYGSSNPNFGFWHGNKKTKIVNRIFFDDNGDIVHSKDRPYFTRLFNEYFNEGTLEERNQFCLCPQIRLSHVLEVWCKNAGYELINHLGVDLNDIFIQSTRALDGTCAQYGENVLCQYALRLKMVNTFMLPAAGWYEFKWDQVLQDFLLASQTLYVIIVSDNDYVSAILNYNPVEAYNNSSPVLLKKCGGTSAKIYIPPGYVERELHFCVGGYTTGVGWNWINVYDYAPLSIKQLSFDETQGGLNIYRRSFTVCELLPNMSNSDFVKMCLEALGLCFFIGYDKREIELVPYSLIKDCGSIDLTEYILARETETHMPDSVSYHLKFEPVLDGSIDRDKMIDDVHRSLPDLYDNIGKYVLVELTNTVMLNETVEDSSGANGWLLKWIACSGNQDVLECGDGESESVTPSFKIPHQEIIPGVYEFDNPNVNMMYPSIPFKISSDLFNQNDSNEDIILLQYRGLMRWKTDGEAFRQECMLPVYKDEFALRVKRGRYVAKNRCLGETYSMPALVLSNHKCFVYKLKIPKILMRDIEQLVRPSYLPPQEQTRFIIINNVKSIPKKITFQFDNSNSQFVLCEIEAVRLY